MTARLYVSPRCFLCALLEPRLRRWLDRRGWRLEVFKLHADGRAVQVNGPRMEAAGAVPGVPALVIGHLTLVGFGLLKALKRAEKGQR